MTTSDLIRRQLALWMQFDDEYLDQRWMTEIISADFTFTVLGETYRGLEQIEAFNRIRDARDRRGKHILSEPVIEMQGPGAARAVTDYIYVCVDEAGGFRITSVGQYKDQLSRDGEGVWRVTSRTTTRLS